MLVISLLFPIERSQESTATSRPYSVSIITLPKIQTTSTATCRSFEGYNDYGQQPQIRLLTVLCRLRLSVAGGHSIVCQCNTIRLSSLMTSVRRHMHDSDLQYKLVARVLCETRAIRDASVLHEHLTRNKPIAHSDTMYCIIYYLIYLMQRLIQGNTRYTLQMISFYCSAVFLHNGFFSCSTVFNVRQYYCARY